MSIRHGFILPGGTAREQLEQAVPAEQAGWDGVFVWEAPYGVGRSFRGEHLPVRMRPRRPRQRGAARTPADDAARAAELVAPWAEAGCTWWMESRWQDGSAVEARIAAGPPR